jgi:hypothetical protein
MPPEAGQVPRQAPAGLMLPTMHQGTVSLPGHNVPASGGAGHKVIALSQAGQMARVIGL